MHFKSFASHYGRHISVLFEDRNLIMFAIVHECHYFNETQTLGKQPCCLLITDYAVVRKNLFSEFIHQYSLETVSLIELSLVIRFCVVVKIKVNVYYHLEQF